MNDVGETSSLSALPNSGPVLESQLNEVGIHTVSQLEAIGSCGAWLRILDIDQSACTNRLLSLEGAVRGVSKKMLDDDTRASLRDFVQTNKPLHIW